MIILKPKHVLNANKTNRTNHTPGYVFFFIHLKYLFVSRMYLFRFYIWYLGFIHLNILLWPIWYLLFGHSSFSPSYFRKISCTKCILNIIYKPFVRKKNQGLNMKTDIEIVNIHFLVKVFYVLGIWRVATAAIGHS